MSPIQDNVAIHSSIHPSIHPSKTTSHPSTATKPSLQDDKAIHSRRHVIHPKPALSETVHPSLPPPIIVCPRPIKSSQRPKRIPSPSRRTVWNSDVPGGYAPTPNSQEKKKGGQKGKGDVCALQKEKEKKVKTNLFDGYRLFSGKSTAAPTSQRSPEKTENADVAKQVSVGRSC
ncbi:uncharacterized protein BDZ99DRAFT_3220 [Mytilinidion resinicola]|uniref:Uncharacterized protein n=1 Tax=Mytilinidion resinicola TaxID=574789 RepID=A0A6A6Z811_9PEZI|nr:uncharacterized protein BDZ99DRAFT_3220 [Mytilinidion resinicola]KAF2816849.1 hypothetical protein BDZ99DRAFT_3220 [Mytilinidion resinicola]